MEISGRLAGPGWIETILRPHQGIDETPDDGGVIAVGRARKSFGAVPITKGARVIDSTPPANCESISPIESRGPRHERIETDRTEKVERLVGGRGGGGGGGGQRKTRHGAH